MSSLSLITPLQGTHIQSQQRPSSVAVKPKRTRTPLNFVAPNQNPSPPPISPFRIKHLSSQKETSTVNTARNQPLLNQIPRDLQTLILDEVDASCFVNLRQMSEAKTMLSNYYKTKEDQYIKRAKEFKQDLTSLDAAIKKASSSVIGLVSSTNEQNLLWEFPNDSLKTPRKSAELQPSTVKNKLKTKFNLKAQDQFQEIKLSLEQKEKMLKLFQYSAIFSIRFLCSKYPHIQTALKAFERTNESDILKAAFCNDERIEYAAAVKHEANTPDSLYLLSPDSQVRKTPPGDLSRAMEGDVVQTTDAKGPLTIVIAQEKVGSLIGTPELVPICPYQRANSAD